MTSAVDCVVHAHRTSFEQSLNRHLAEKGAAAEYDTSKSPEDHFGDGDSLVVSKSEDGCSPHAEIHFFAKIIGNAVVIVEVEIEFTHVVGSH